MIINPIIFGSGGGETPVYHTSGTASFHTGTDSQSMVLPLPDTSYDMYLIATYILKTWKLVDGVWVEQAGLDFNGSSKTVYTFKRVAVAGLSTSILPTKFSYIASNGTQKNNQTVDTYRSMSVIYNISSAMRSQNMTATAPTISTTNKTISVPAVSGATDYTSTTTHGTTHHYDIWGWNNQ